MSKLAWLWPVPLLVAALAGADCAPPYDCSDVGRAELYSKRIEPLLTDDRPKSCNQCHLSGLDLTIFIKDTPCNTMACMARKGLVDLQQPEQSLLLSWIDRATPDSEGISAQVLAEERQGVLEWIEMTAYCGACMAEMDPAADPCAEGFKPKCEVSEHEAATFDQTDPGGCDDAVLEQLFANYFYPYRKRCFPCHFTDSTIAAPKWIVEGECYSSAAATLNRLLALNVIDIDNPSQSNWILKPLDEDLGGIEHGGGSKFHDGDEEALVAMLYWVNRYAECQNQ